MFKKSLNISLLAGLLMLSIFSSAQDPSFSQFYANPLYLNPAFAGSIYCGRITLNYRNQWPSISNGFVTYNAAYDQSLDKLSSGYGLMFTGDNMGDGALASNTISGIYSYKFQASNNINVSFGMQASYYQLKMDWDKYIFGDMIDPNTGSTTNPTMESPENWNENVSFVDFSAGVMAGYSDKFFAGLAVHHLTEPDNALNKNSESKLPMKISAHAGTQISLETGALGAGEPDELTISPNILYQQQQGFHQLNLGIYTNIYPFVAGLWFRHNFENPDAAIVLLGFKQDKYKIGYSYDFTVSELGAKSGGAHEISFAWEFCIIREAVKRRKIKAIKSPTF